MQGRVVRFGVRAELAADAQKPGAEILVAPQVLGLEARTLGGEAVGPAQDGELLAEQPGGPGEPLRRVVGLGMAIKPIFKCSAVRVDMRSVSQAARPSLRPMRRITPAPRESWETKRTLPSSSRRVTGLATSCSRAARRRPCTPSSPTLAPILLSFSSRSTPLTTSRT
jgi:hypothetical protein